MFRKFLKWPPPDQSSLHLIRELFHVAIPHEDHVDVDWLEQRPEGAMVLLTMRSFSSETNPSELIVAQLLVFNDSTPRAFRWRDENKNLIFALVLENGKIVTAKNGMVSFGLILGEDDFLVGIRLWLHVANDPEQKVLQFRDPNNPEKSIPAERVFLIPKKE